MVCLTSRTVEKKNTNEKMMPHVKGLLLLILKLH